MRITAGWTYPSTASITMQDATRGRRVFIVERAGGGWEVHVTYDYPRTHKGSYLHSTHDTRDQAADVAALEVLMTLYQTEDYR